jgi:hypothetical protein
MAQEPFEMLFMPRLISLPKYRIIKIYPAKSLTSLVTLQKESGENRRQLRINTPNINRNLELRPWRPVTAWTLG